MFTQDQESGLFFQNPSTNTSLNYFYKQQQQQYTNLTYFNLEGQDYIQITKQYEFIYVFKLNQYFFEIPPNNYILVCSCIRQNNSQCIVNCATLKIDSLYKFILELQIQHDHLYIIHPDTQTVYLKIEKKQNDQFYNLHQNFDQEYLYQLTEEQKKYFYSQIPQHYFQFHQNDIYQNYYFSFANINHSDILNFTFNHSNNDEHIAVVVPVQMIEIDDNYKNQNTTPHKHLNNIFLIINIIDKEQLLQNIYKINDMIFQYQLVSGLVISFIFIFSFIIVYYYSQIISNNIEAPIVHVTKILESVKIDQVNDELKGYLKQFQQLDQYHSKDASILYSSLINIFIMLKYAKNQYYQGNDSQSLLDWESASAFFKQFNNRRALGICYNNMANIHLKNERYKEAMQYYEIALIQVEYELGILGNQNEEDQGLSIYRSDLQQSKFDRLYSYSQALKGYCLKQKQAQLWIEFLSIMKNILIESKLIQKESRGRQIVIYLDISYGLMKIKNLTKAKLALQLAQREFLQISQERYEKKILTMRQKLFKEENINKKQNFKNINNKDIFISNKDVRQYQSDEDQKLLQSDQALIKGEQQEEKKMQKTVQFKLQQSISENKVNESIIQNNKQKKKKKITFEGISDHNLNLFENILVETGEEIRHRQGTQHLIRVSSNTNGEENKNSLIAHQAQSSLEDKKISSNKLEESMKIMSLTMRQQLSSSQKKNISRFSLNNGSIPQSADFQSPIKILKKPSLLIQQQTINEQANFSFQQQQQNQPDPSPSNRLNQISANEINMQKSGNSLNIHSNQQLNYSKNKGYQISQNRLSVFSSDSLSKLNLHNFSQLSVLRCKSRQSIKSLQEIILSSKMRQKQMRDDRKMANYEFPIDIFQQKIDLQEALINIEEKKFYKAALLLTESIEVSKFYFPYERRLQLEIIKQILMRYELKTWSIDRFLIRYNPIIFQCCILIDVKNADQIVLAFQMAKQIVQHVLVNMEDSFNLIVIADSCIQAIAPIKKKLADLILNRIWKNLFQKCEVIKNYTIDRSNPLPKRRLHEGLIAAISGFYNNIIQMRMEKQNLKNLETLSTTQKFIICLTESGFGQIDYKWNQFFKKSMEELNIKMLVYDFSSNDDELNFTFVVEENQQYIDKIRHFANINKLIVYLENQREHHNNVGQPVIVENF